MNCRRRWTGDRGGGIPSWPQGSRIRRGPECGDWLRSRGALFCSKEFAWWTVTNAIGTVRLAWSNGPIAEVPMARITSGARGFFGYHRIITSHGRSDMSRRIRPALMVVLCLLAALNLGAFILQVSPPSRAAVAGMSYQDLMRDPDFTRAVQSIAQECRVNIDLAKLVCLPQR